MRAIRHKRISTIKQEWDAIAEMRHEQMTSAKDISYRFVILPCLLSLSEGCDFSSVVDFGCGSGVLDKKIAPLCGELVGIDISAKSLGLARELCGSFKNVRFVNERIEDFSSRADAPMFTLAIANMTLMTCINLNSALRALRRLVVPGGTFVATLTHPCFWPDYWGYSSADWFEYTDEIIIEAAFRISTESSQYVTTHVHRPIMTYFMSLIKLGFEIDKILEPVPSKSIQAKYPMPWRYPRFIGIRCIRR